MSDKKPYINARQITPGTPVAAGDAVFINCTVAGNVTLKMKGGGTFLFPAAVGPNLLDDFAVTDAPATGTTATATVYVFER